MKTICRLVFSVVVLFSSLGFAKGSASMLRGGIGFLFPDGNSFYNPGQMALNKGAALEGYYTRLNGSQIQALNSSLVWGSGKFGLGAFVNRTGTSLTNGSACTDVVGAALGLGFSQEKFTLGVEAHRSISRGQTNNGILNASLNYNGAKRMGISLGAAVGTTLNANTRNRTATLGLGYGITSLSSIEANYTINNLDNTSDYTMAGALTLGGQAVYFAVAYNYYKVLALSALLARFGLNFGPCDISVHAEKILKSGYQHTYGGTFRIMF